MSETPLPTEIPLPRIIQPLWLRWRQWWRAWHAAQAAADAYEGARAGGMPRGVAASSAFEALTDDDPPASPAVAIEARSGTVVTPQPAPRTAGAA